MERTVNMQLRQLTAVEDPLIVLYVGSESWGTNADSVTQTKMTEISGGKCTMSSILERL